MRHHAGMSEREQLIRQAYDGLSVGDLDAVMAACHEDVTWDWSRSLAPFAGVYHGREGLRTLYESFMLAAARLTLAVEGVEAFGDDYIVQIRADVRVHSGAEGSARSPHVMTFDGDRVRHHMLFQERAEAVAAISERGSRAGRIG